MVMEELGPAERFAAGAVGSPGHRRFFLEVTANGVRHTLPAEKEQVAALATQGLAALEESDVEADEEAVSRILEGGLDVDEPTEERFAVGSIVVAVGGSGLVGVTVESAEGDEGVRFVVAPEQFRAMALHALEVVAAGRPTCPWCRLPMDPEGHECPARN